MIIGNGMLAQEFTQYKNDDSILIFAAGVSNSTECRESEFIREKKLLQNSIKNIENMKIIYFSTCSMYDEYFQKNAYTMHKLEMERLISCSNCSHTIFRLPQVLGSNNKHQLMGFLYEKIKNNQTFELYDIERNIIDSSDVKLLVTYILENKLFKNKIVNIANPLNIRVLDLVKKIELIYGYKAQYNTVKLDGEFIINTELILDILNKLNIFTENYLEKRIRKYYG